MDKLSKVKTRYIEYIDNLIKNKKISHSYLIEVDNYDSDFYFVLSFVKMIFCDISYEELSNFTDDNIVNLIDSNNYPDLKIIEPSGSSIRKNQLLDLQKDYSNKSLLNGKRIYIIKNAEKLNVSSANTMLKFLEEPEDNIIAFLLTENRYKIIDTISSRCQILSIKEYNYGLDCDSNIVDLLNCIIKPESFFIKYKHIFDNVLVDKNNCIRLLNIIENYIIDYIKYDNSIIDNYNSDIYNILKGSDNNYLLHVLSVIESDIIKLQYNVNFKLWLDSLFSKFIGGIYD